MTMKIILPKDGEIFQKNLDKLWRNCDWQWPHYTRSAKNYNNLLFSERGPIEDISFIMEWNREPLIALLGFSPIDYDSIDVPCFIIAETDRLSKKAAKCFLDNFDKTIKGSSKKFWYRDFLLDGKISFLSKALLRQGFNFSTIFSNVIDLSKSEVTLKSNIRKSYGSLINKGIRDLSPTIIDSSSITWDKIDEFRKLHIKEAGRETRSKETWEEQFNMIKSDEAFVAFGYLDSDLVSAGLFSMSSKNVYYLASASRRDLFPKPLFHALIWKAILYSKSRGLNWFEIGEKLFPNSSDVLHSQKELSISNFKSGFGASIKVFLDFKIN